MEHENGGYKMNIQKMYTAVDVHVNGEAFRVMKDVPCNTTTVWSN